MYFVDQLCTVPVVPNGGFRNCTTGARIEVRETCTVACDSGYRPSEATVTCRNRSEIQVPSCSGIYIYIYIYIFQKKCKLLMANSNKDQYASIIQLHNADVSCL